MYNLWLEYIILINQEESTAMINVVQMRRRSQGLRCVLEWKHNNHFRYIANRLLPSVTIINSQASIRQSIFELFLCSTIRIKEMRFQKRQSSATSSFEIHARFY